MGLLDGLIGQVASQALGDKAQGGGIGGMISGALGNALGGEQSGGLDIASVLGSVMGGEGQTGAMAFMPLVLGWIQRSGGISEAFEALKSAGLGDIASSFMGDGDNQALDPSVVSDLIGNEHVQAFADKSGIDVDSVKSGVAEALPEVLNKLTPQGGLEDAEAANSEVGNLMAQFSKFM